MPIKYENQLAENCNLLEDTWPQCAIAHLLIVKVSPSLRGKTVVSLKRSLVRFQHQRADGWLPHGIAFAGFVVRKSNQTRVQKRAFKPFMSKFPLMHRQWLRVETKWPFNNNATVFTVMDLVSQAEAEFMLHWKWNRNKWLPGKWDK